MMSTPLENKSEGNSEVDPVSGLGNVEPTDKQDSGSNAKSSRELHYEKSMNESVSLSVSDILKSVKLQPSQDSHNETLERLWASSAEVDHQLETLRNRSVDSETINSSTEMKEAILKKGTSYRSFFKKTKSARACMA